MRRDRHVRSYQDRHVRSYADIVKVIGVEEHVMRHEALLFRIEVRDLHRFAVLAAG